MFAVVRTGGKQYRVAPGDKIVVEKLAGEAGETISLGDVLLAGEGSELRATEGLSVSAEIIAQAKAEKVIVFKKRRRHNYRRKNGHRQQHTILRITAIGDSQAEKPKKAAKAPKPADEAPVADQALETRVDTVAEVSEAPAKKPRAKKAAPAAPADTEAHVQPPLKVDGAESEMTDNPVSAKNDSE
ncbi:MAG: LSU ribosomal protein L21p [uncultured Sphingosinicella sp.]|uniref:Large ribosomal subunit protein bL21 n=1 Tax=uncultured Sphingosinicella sp. TaxID=478748 RepID=A0A6J4TQ47_9SPHN|nr:50S ribosomal protein L21 [uncultured Sphingosinicella sp.]CAA9528520.1 MAG: LSU ribosomal protein L21p [uncultured Sphingosinicella sp.]